MYINYLKWLPEFERAYKQSTAIRSKADPTGICKIGALGVAHRFFFIEQCVHERIQASQSRNIFFQKYLSLILSYVFCIYVVLNVCIPPGRCHDNGLRPRVLNYVVPLTEDFFFTERLFEYAR